MSQRTYSHYVYGRTTQTRTHAGGPTDTDITEAEHADQCTLGGWSHTTDRTGRHYLLTTARTADMPDTGHGKYSTGGRISRLQKKTTGSDGKNSCGTTASGSLCSAPVVFPAPQFGPSFSSGAFSAPPLDADSQCPTAVVERPAGHRLVVTGRSLC